MVYVKENWKIQLDLKCTYIPGKHLDAECVNRKKTTLSDIKDLFRKEHIGPQPLMIEYLNMSRS